MKNKNQMWVKALTALTISSSPLVLAGCAASSANAGYESPSQVPQEYLDQEGFHREDEVGAMLKNAIDAFPEELPSGAKWSYEVPEGLIEEGAIFETGVPSNYVSGYWLCGWMDAALKARDDKDADALSHVFEQIEKFETLPNTIAVWPKDELERWHEFYIEDPKAGDFTFYEDEVDGGCDLYFQVNPRA